MFGVYFSKVFWRVFISILVHEQSWSIEIETTTIQDFVKLKLNKFWILNISKWPHDKWTEDNFQTPFQVHWISSTQFFFARCQQLMQNWMLIIRFSIEAKKVLRVCNVIHSQSRLIDWMYDLRCKRRMKSCGNLLTNRM